MMTNSDLLVDLIITGYNVLFITNELSDVMTYERLDKKSYGYRRC